MMYGNSSMGFSYSPDRSHDVSHDNLHSKFLGANGNRATGYHYSPSQSSKPQGNGEWRQSGGGLWYKA